MMNGENKEVLPGWWMCTSKGRGLIYFYNVKDGSSLWENEFYQKYGTELTNNVPVQNTLNEMAGEENDDSDDELLAKLIKAKDKKNEEKELLKERRVSQCPNGDANQISINDRSSESSSTLTNLSRHNSEVPNKVQKNIHKGSSGNIAADGRSENSIPSNSGMTSSTPIQDRFERQRKELLMKQEKNTKSEVSLSLPNEDRSPNVFLQDGLGNCKRKQRQKNGLFFKTPIQDKYNKKREELLNKQKEKSCNWRNSFDFEQRNPRPVLPTDQIKTVREMGQSMRTGSLLSIKDRDQTQKKTIQSQAQCSGLKRKLCDQDKSQRHISLESGTSSRKTISFAHIPQSQSAESTPKTRTPITFSKPQSHSAESTPQTRKPITFSQPKRPKTKSETTDKKPDNFGGRKPPNLSSEMVSPYYEPQTFGGRKPPNLSSKMGSPDYEPQTFGGRKPPNLRSEMISPDHEPQISDLREKLQQRKTAPNLEPDVSMEWEPSYEPEFIHCEAINRQTPPSTDERRPQFSNVYLVCDTSALINDEPFVETLVTKGSYLGLPLIIVIPFVVLDELDQIKTKSDVGHIARKLIRVIQSCHSNKHLLLQEGSKKRDAVGSLELKVNDDLVLNCCLQMKEKCGENELATMITSDINLRNKASSCNVQSYDWYSFKKWARGFREYKILPVPSRTAKQESPLNMLVDEVTSAKENNDLNTSSENKSTRLDGPCNNKMMSEKFSSDTASTSTICSQLNNIVQSHVDEFKSDLQTFLHDLLEEAIEKEYGGLKEYSNRIKASWTVINYIAEVQKRWFLISGSHDPIQVKDALHQLASSFKKHNAGKVLESSEVNALFRSCFVLANVIAKYFAQRAHLFSEKLKILEEDWKEALNSNLFPSNDQTAEEEEDVQPMDVALQNIYCCSQSDYALVKSQIGSNSLDKTIEEQIPRFYGRVTDFEIVLRRLFQKEPDQLNIKTIEVLKLHEMVTFSSDVKGNPIGFEISLENILELFLDKAYRKNVEKLIGKFENLKSCIDELINCLE